MTGRTRTWRATRGRVPPRSGSRAPTARVTATRLRQVRKRRAAAGFPPAPAFCPRILARPVGVSHATADVPAPPPVGGDGIPADLPANGARTGPGPRRRLGGRAPRERTRFRRHAAAVADTTHAPGTPPRNGEVLLFSLHNYRIVASLGLDMLSLRAFGVVVDTGAGPNLVRRDALAPEWLRQVLTSKEEEQVRLRDANNARLRTSGTVTLWLQTGARIVPVPVLVVDDLSVPVILGCTFIDDNDHAILPQDRSIRWTDGSVTAILRGPLDDADRSMGVSCVLRATHKTRLPPSAATIVWVRTMWGGLGQVFGASRLFTTHGVTIANGVHDIVPGLSFPVIVTNFGAREVILRQKANVGYVELLTTGVVQVPPGGPPGTPAAPASPPATAAEGVVAAVSSTGDDSAAGRSPDPATASGGAAATPARPRDPGEESALAVAALPASPPQVEDVDLPDVDPTLHTRIRRMLDQHKAMSTGQALGVI